MTIEERLTALYQRFTDRRAIEAACSSPESAAIMIQEIDGPFLIRSREEYEQSKQKVLIVGQENNGWIGTYKNFLEKKSIADALLLYDQFNLEQTYNTTFFQYFATIRDSIFTSEPRSKRAILWLNLFKFNQGMNPQMIYSEYRENVLALQDDVFQQEVAVLRPDVIIFLTGPYYDPVIQRFFPEVKYKQIAGHPINQVAQLVHERLPTLSFRTYHPGYMSRVRERTAHCLPAILKMIADTSGSE